jgi:hypothetical protein
MKSFVLAAVIFAAAAIFGAILQDKPYRLQALYHPLDQYALDHRDSVYSNITWVVAPSDSSQQLRFFDRVEGGVQTHPSWNDLVEMGKTDSRLAHLVADGALPDQQSPGPDWPHAWAPNPGTLPNTKYVNLFPLGVLLNDRLMAEAKNDFRAAKPKVIVIGLGSGIGIAVLAHHFPHAEITVVDIDQVVNDMVVDHYPLLRWLTTQKNADGTPRLRLVARDARQFIKFDAVREAQKRKFDLVVMDAYTSGSTIPPHLMTREFFAEIARILDDDGKMMSNIIGSYAGEKKMVLGGAIRSMCAAGLTDTYNFPVLNPYQRETPTSFKDTDGRNNIVIAGRKPIDPSGKRGNPAAWERIRNFIAFPELAVGKYVTKSVYLCDGTLENFRATTSSVDIGLLEKADPALGKRFVAKPDRSNSPHMTFQVCQDSATVEQMKRTVLLDPGVGKAAAETGWNERATFATMRRIDWVLHAREAFSTSVASAKDQAQHGALALTGPPEGPQRETQQTSALGANWKIADAPLFTDAMPNADIYNR